MNWINSTILQTLLYLILFNNASSGHNSQQLSTTPSTTTLNEKKEPSLSALPSTFRRFDDTIEKDKKPPIGYTIYENAECSIQNLNKNVLTDEIDDEKTVFDTIKQRSNKKRKKRKKILDLEMRSYRSEKNKLKTKRSRLKCPECNKIHCDQKAIKCNNGWTTDLCGCCSVCARGAGEKCGGVLGYLGVCGQGLVCVHKEPGTKHKDDNEMSLVDGGEGALRRVDGNNEIHSRENLKRFDYLKNHERKKIFKRKNQKLQNIYAVKKRYENILESNKSNNENLLKKKYIKTNLAFFHKNRISRTNDNSNFFYEQVKKQKKDVDDMIKARKNNKNDFYKKNFKEKKFTKKKNQIESNKERIDDMESKNTARVGRARSHYGRIKVNPIKNKEIEGSESGKKTNVMARKRKKEDHRRKTRKRNTTAKLFQIKKRRKTNKNKGNRKYKYYKSKFGFHRKIPSNKSNRSGSVRKHKRRTSHKFQQEGVCFPGQFYSSSHSLLSSINANL